MDVNSCFLFSIVSSSMLCKIASFSVIHKLHLLPFPLNTCTLLKITHSVVESKLPASFICQEHVDKVVAFLYFLFVQAELMIVKCSSYPTEATNVKSFVVPATGCGLVDQFSVKHLPRSGQSSLFQQLHALSLLVLFLLLLNISLLWLLINLAMQPE